MVAKDQQAECPAGGPENCPVPERRHDDRWRHEVRERIAVIEQTLAANTEATVLNAETVARIDKATAEIVEFFEAGKGFFSVVRVVGVAAKWVTTVAAAVALAWVLFRGGD